MNEATHIAEQHELQQQARQIKERWANVYSAFDERSSLLTKALQAWTTFNKSAEHVQKVEDKIAEKLALEPNLYAVEISSLEQQIGTHRVRMVSRVKVEKSLYDLCFCTCIGESDLLV